MPGEEPKHIFEPGGTEVSTAAGGARRYRKPLKSLRWCDIEFLFGESFDAWNKHKAPRLGASLAFYTLLSLTPLLLVMVAVVGLVFGHATAEREIVRQVQMLIGAQGAKAIEALLQASRNTTHGAVAAIAGIVTLLFGASGVMIELRDALNTIWEVPTPKLRGIRGRMTREDVILGGAVTSFFFTIGKSLLGLYLGKAGIASSYGAFASIVVVVIWVYYSGQILFLGAEFTRTFANHYGSQPTRNPESIVKLPGNTEPPATEEPRIITPPGTS